MQQTRTGYRRMVSGARRVQAAVWRGVGVGGLAGLLLLPLDVGAVGSGDLDPSFGGDGTVLTDFGDFGGQFGDYARALALQADGKIVVAGSALDLGNCCQDFALARFLPNGTLDATFGGDGTVTTDSGVGVNAGASALALQADGKIVVAGSSDASGNGDFALARYLPNGTLDASFGGDGTVFTDFGSGSSDGASALALQADGKIVMAGGSTASGSETFALARYLPNGTLDTTFGGDGRVLTNFGSGSSDRASALALQADGKIVVAGWSLNANGDWAFVFNLARYLPNGTLDTTFSGDGKVTTDWGGAAAASALALQPNGKIVVAGWSFNASGGTDFALARFLPNGTLDATFGGDGKVTTDFGIHEIASALAIQPRDGRLVVAGYSTDDGNFSVFALARYHAITCNGVVATRVGTAGNDTIVGTAGRDVIVGFDGDDTIHGLGGNDLLCGNAGNDTLVGGTGDDTLVGNAGTDVCDGGSHVGKDTASGCESVTGVP